MTGMAGGEGSALDAAVEVQEDTAAPVPLDMHDRLVRDAAAAVEAAERKVKQAEVDRAAADMAVERATETLAAATAARDEAAARDPRG